MVYKEIKMIYKNSLSIKGIGDPFILKTNYGRYFCYATSAIDTGFKAWSSDDLQNWKEEGLVYEKTEYSWGYTKFWAPEVLEYNGKYYMHYTALWKKNNSLRIGVAVSDNPLGPFKDIINSPMFDFDFAAIDGNVLIDEDGKKYLYFSRDCSENIFEGRNESHIYGIELNDDLISVKGQPLCLTRPDSVWEMKPGRKNRWNEGPFVFKRNGLYYLMYSANCFADRWYAVGYATSTTPLGPFKKYEFNPVLESNCQEISGPGHNSVTVSPDGRDWLIVYHTHTDPAQGGGNRQLCIDKMGFREDGSIYVEGPTIAYLSTS